MGLSTIRSWLKESTDIPSPTARRVFVTLRLHADEQLTCSPSIRQIAEDTPCSQATARRHLRWLWLNGWITQQRQPSREDGTFRQNRYVLNPKKLNVSLPGTVDENTVFSSSAADADRKVEPSVSVITPSAKLHEGLGHPERWTALAERWRHIDSRACARASSPSFPSSPLDEVERKEFKALIFSVCGQGLGDPRTDPSIETSLDRRLEPWRIFDLGIVLQVVMQQTDKKRKRQITDFKVIEPDLWAKLRGSTDVGSDVPPRPRAPSAPKAPALQTDTRSSRLQKIEGHRNMIRCLRGGDRPRHLLTPEQHRLPSEQTERLFAKIMETYETELRELLDEEEK